METRSKRSKRPEEKALDPPGAVILGPSSDHEPEPVTKKAKKAPAKKAPAQPKKEAKPKKDAKPKKEKKPKKARLICASKARDMYAVTDRDLAALTCELAPNPHYPGGAPMRLYAEPEVILLSKNKQAQLKYKRDHAEERAEAKAAADRAKRKAAGEAARAALTGFKLPTAGEGVQAGATPLPQEVWALVFEQLARTLEPPGCVRGPGVVAADIARGGLACRDMFIASRAGLAALAAHEALPVADWGRPMPEPASRTDGSVQKADWGRWDRLLRTPLDCKAPELKEAVRELGLPVTATKAELVLRLLGHFGLAARCTLPARLWVALRQERSPLGGRLSAQVSTALRDLWEGANEAAGRALSQPSVADSRRELVAAWGDTAGLMAAHLACLPALSRLRVQRAEQRRAEEERRRAQVEAARLEQARRWEEERLRREADYQRHAEQRRAAAMQGLPARQATLVGGAAGVVCACGNAAAKACPMLLCGMCCPRGGCPRHG